MKFFPIVYLIGILLCILALFMLIPALVDWFYGGNDWPAFLGSSLITFLFSIILTGNNIASDTDYNICATNADGAILVIENFIK